MKKMKLFALCIASLAFVFTACDKDKDKDGDGGGGSTNIISGNTIAVDVIDGASYDVDSVYIIGFYHNIAYQEEVIIARAAYNKGKFSIKLPEVLSAGYLRNVKEQYDSESITFSDEQANVSDNMYLEAYKGESFVGYIELTDDSGATPYEAASFIYVDRTLTMTGEYIDEEDKEKATLNVSYVKGWNTMFELIYEKDGYEITEYTSTGRTGLKWYLVEDDGGSSNAENAPRLKKAVLKK